MDDQPKPIPGYLAWPVVIVAFIFWPVGLVLLSLRLSMDRSSQMIAGGTLIVVGWLIAIFSFFVAAVGLTSSKNLNGGDAGAAVFCALVGFGGVLLARKGAALRKKRKLVQHYIALIVNQGHTSVDQIAVLSGRSDFNQVMAEIQTLINEGFLHGYRLDIDERRVFRMAPESNLTQHVGFSCKSCGANNLILATGAFTRCEYCGTPVRV